MLGIFVTKKDKRDGVFHACLSRKTFGACSMVCDVNERNIKKPCKLVNPFEMVP